MQARRVVLAILALPGLCARRTVVGNLSAAVANGPHPGMVSNFGPDRQPRWPGAHGNGTSLGPRALAFQIGARWAHLEFSVATRDSAFERFPSEDRGDAGATVERLRWLRRTGASTPNERAAVAGWRDSAVTQLSR
jgi:hypothetical protein